MPVRDIQGCHFSSANICEVFCSCYATHTVLIEGQRGVRDDCAGQGGGGPKRDVRVVLGQQCRPIKDTSASCDLSPKQQLKKELFNKKKKSRLYPRQLEVLGPVKSITANNVYIPVDEHVQGKDGG